MACLEFESGSVGNSTPARSAKSAADNHCTMVVSVAMAREQAQLIIRGAESAGGRSGVAARCRPAVALPLGLTAVGAGVGRVSWVGLLHAQGLPYALRSSFFGLVPGELVLGGVRELQVVLSRILNLRVWGLRSRVA